jgi:hypothetical protein
VDPFAQLNEETGEEEDEDDFGVEMTGGRIGRSDPEPIFGTFGDQMEDTGRRGPRARKLGGHLASLAQGAKELERERERERRNIVARTPQNIEKALREQAERFRHRRRVKAVCPNPYRHVRSFLADPVTRFWLGCNMCCFIALFVGSILFMTLIYPVALRPTLKY